ncbi:unnamed protein product [Aureobasidium uvarum]|uniref:Uncharacterized protein n=1 Tax=Aureobasidium uvarum TaxID=2773716 RepID=A0A9N8KC83_9PEZI|nr:unnamed protein product [Aureobasidium uvarum]
MVETDYDRIQKEEQEKSNEDASVLSFVSEHTKVQKILYEEYDDFTNSKKQEIVLRALGNINQTIVGIPARVRTTSNWKTKFNAFLTLLWIGRGIVDGIGMLPNAIRAQMAFDSKLVEAIDDVYETMSKTEILRDGARLFEALVDLNKDREHCFEGLDTIVEVFQDAMRQERPGQE